MTASSHKNDVERFQCRFYILNARKHSESCYIYHGKKGTINYLLTEGGYIREISNRGLAVLTE